MTNKTKIDIRLEFRVSGLQELDFSKVFLLWLLVSSLTAPGAFSQLKVYPLPRTTDQVQLQSKSRNSIARTQDAAPRSLPFWDDFSTTLMDKEGDPLSNYPADSLWVYNKTVWISSGMGINPPSMNVASFDGLGPDNLPYSDQILSNGFRDTLLSQPIKLAEVASPDRNSVYLSFFYQWGGNGEPPDAKDYLRVDFKNDQGIWETVMTIPTSPSFTIDAFYDTLVKVEGDKFFHNEFQFRFMNYGRQSGPYDTWNVDYIYLNKNRNATDRYLPDRTITSSILSGLFNKYRAVPYHQFIVSQVKTPPQFGVFNVNNTIATLSYFTQAIFTTYKDGVTTVLPIDTLGDDGTSPISGTTGIINSRERKTVTLQHIDALNLFDPDADSVDLSLKVRLFTGDTFNPKTGAFADDYDPAKYVPLDFRSNDTVRTDYALRNYFAYDDGTGEYAVGLTAFSNRAAVLFEMLTPVPDTLVGFDIYIPDYGFISNLNVDFTVYNDEGGVPGVSLRTIPSITIKKNGQNKFQRVPIYEPFLVQDKFYIGWKAPVGGALKVGLDTNNDSGEKIFLNVSGYWEQNTTFTGSVMIRPIFGKGGTIVGVPDEHIQSLLYPNPNRGEFFAPNTLEILQVFNTIGQSVPFKTQAEGDQNKITLSNVSPGLYILRVQQGAKLFSSKIFVN